MGQSTNFFCKGQDSKYLGLAVYVSSITTTQLCCNSPKVVINNTLMNGSGCVLFTKTEGRSDLALQLWLANP